MQNEFFWNKALETTKCAVERKALIPIETSKKYIKSKFDDFFEVRTLKTKHSLGLSEYGPTSNPFSPWDKNLEISLILDSHVLILNKYPVQLGHMLLITSQWQPQNGWLNPSDWEALCKVNLDTQGLWFFNSCPLSGASQPHRHLQLLRRGKGELNCPRESWFLRLLNCELKQETIVERSVVVRSNRGEFSKPSSKLFYENYLNMASELGLGSPNSTTKPLHPYNLLITPDWMALIRRSTECAFGFSINALGFAGYLLSIDQSNESWLSKNGPEKLLEYVSDPP